MPLIGIVATSGEDRSKPYAETIEAHGGSVVLLKTGDDFVHRGLQGVLLTGGGDLSECYYDHPLSEEERKTLGRIEPGREKYEFEILKWASDRGVPVLGICRGSQIMNVFCKGTLIPDLPTWQESKKILPKINHRDPGEASEPAHSIDIVPGSRLSAILENRSRIEVNTSHHQALSRLGKGLESTARAPDQVIEAFEDPKRKFWIGVQFHPERMWKKYSIFSKLFEAFMEATRGTVGY